jgi:WD40 repeat protein
MAVGDDGRIRFFDARTGAPERTVNGEGRDLNAGAYSADGRRFAAGGQDGVTRVWSVDGGPPVAVLRGQRSRVLDLGFGSTNRQVVSAAEAGTVRIWDAGSAQAWTNSSPSFGLDFSHDGGSVLAGSVDGDVRVWDPATGRLQAHWNGPEGGAYGSFSPAEDSVLIANDTRRARLWPTAARLATTAAQAPPGRQITSADFDAKGARIVYVEATSEGVTTAVAVRDLASGRDVELKGWPKGMYGAVFTPDGKYVLSLPDRDPLVWRIDRPDAPMSHLDSGPVNEISTGRGDKMLTAGSDETVRMWDPSGKELAVMRGNEDEVTTAIFTTDETQVLSSGQDGSLRLFEADSGKQLAAFESTGQLVDVAQTRDGTLATLDARAAVHVFPCDFCGSIDRVRGIALARSPRELTPGERRQFLAAAG